MSIASGERYTFVSADGHRTEYVVDDFERDVKPSSLVWLLNPLTGRKATVTAKWLTEGELSGRAHWRAA